jgi:hypothetical protein
MDMSLNGGNWKSIKIESIERKSVWEKWISKDWIVKSMSGHLGIFVIIVSRMFQTLKFGRDGGNILVSMGYKFQILVWYTFVYMPYGS